MGYCINQVDSAFTMSRDNHDAAFKAAISMPDKDYHWVKRDWSSEMKSIEDVLNHWGYEPEVAESTGDIISLTCNTEKLGEEFELFKAIAPYVEAGSFIEMSGEDGAQWRWIFNGKECKEVYPKIEWEE